jgi:D-threo-aldose 1-dehydrogenase
VIIASITIGTDRREGAGVEEERMAFEPTDRVSIGRTGLSVTRLGFGAASIGGVFDVIDERVGLATIEHAWDLGIRYFDVAPLYGYGTSERRLGRSLAGRPRDDFVLSTKVGRLVRRAEEIEAGADVDRNAFGDRRDADRTEDTGFRAVFDFSRDGILRSIDESLERLGLARIDIVFLHDPDDHWEAAIAEAYPALHRLREDGVVRAIGAGMNQSEMLTRFAREGDFDVFLVAGRYTLLDQGALRELLPTCIERNVAVVIGGVMNSGILAAPGQAGRFNYKPAPADVIDRARRLAAICDRHGVPLKAAAIQFPLAHPAVASVVAGVGRIEHLDDYPAAMRQVIPGELWAELRAEGLIAPDAPVPDGAS